MSDRTNIEVIDQDEDSTALALPSLGMQQLIAHARSARRDIKSVVTNITTLATLDEESASECLYALVRRRKRLNADEVDSDRENKAIEGPSIRLAEIAAQCFGNCVSDAYRVRVDRTDKVVIAQGIF